MKRILAIMLSLIMSLNLVVIGCYAANEEDIARAADAKTLIASYDAPINNTLSNRELMNSVCDDLSLLEVAHLDTFVEIDSVDAAGNVTYQIPIDDNTADTVTVTSNSTGDVIVNIQEGTISNELVYAADGSIYLDGAPAFTIEDVEDISSVCSETSDSSEIDPTSVFRAGPITKFVAVKYTKSNIPSTFIYKSGVTGKSVSFSASLATMAVGTFISLFVSASVGVAVTALGVATAIASSALTEALNIRTTEITAFKTAAPNAKNVYYKLYTYGKQGNNTLYSEYLYLFEIHKSATFDDSSPLYAASKKITEST